MNVRNLIRQLSYEKELIDRAIAELEGLDAGGVAAISPGRNGGAAKQ